MGNATALTDGANLYNVQVGSTTYLSSVSGTNTITATATPTPAYVVGQRFTFVPANTNTGATTLNISSVGAGAVQWAGAALTGGELVAGTPVTVLVTATTPVFEIINATQFPDTRALVVGGTDATKKLRFEVDGLTTATTRVATWQDADGTVAYTSNVFLPRSYLAGCTLSNNGSDATNDVDIAAGACRDSTNAANIIVAALTKRLDANWAAGTNQGMRYSGAAIADTTYHIWAVATAAGTQDIYATPNASASTASAALTLLQAESGGSSYVYARRIGSILRESAAIVGFVQDGDEFQRKTSVLDINANAPGTSAVTRTLSVPLGVRVKWVGVGQAENAGTLQSLLLSDLSVTDETPAASTILAQSTSETTNYGVMPLSVWTNTSAQIRSRVESSSASADIRIRTFGWIDRRGRDD